MYGYTYYINFKKLQILYLIISLGGDNMNFLKWIGVIIIFFWFLAIILNFGGYYINILLLISAIVFLIDSILNPNKSI